MTSAAQESSPWHSTTQSPNAPHTTLFTQERLPQRTSHAPVAGHNTWSVAQLSGASQSKTHAPSKQRPPVRAH
jgi:hypothetical protein